MAVFTTMTSKAQVTIPKRARDAAGLKPGEKVHVAVEAGKVVLTPASKAVKSPFEKIRGTLKDTMSTDEIMALLRGD
ncbi:MAG TPA: AbrB/MazE/SpoVT family DNA-binding domain-containing protein [Rhizomicrobium sp.]|jgi:AbrB family looped-hinge helix DNA binding protein|nr:AbrB/MazE/SpoVT family DNA-binding domain-containing protein [Rhizomicrobium sp.]